MGFRGLGFGGFGFGVSGVGLGVVYGPHPKPLNPKP